MEDHRDKFQKLLRSLFQFENADLDFGIYRIMNFKRDAIERFIQKDLIEAVGKELSSGVLASQSQAAAELNDVARQIRDTLGEAALNGDGVLAEAYRGTPLGKRYSDLQARASGAQTRAVLEAAIFNHLYTFFSRYYDSGDFLSKPRYTRREKYAIPYNGDEVYLHWANSDQYYVKTGEYFSDYQFKAPNGVSVHFKLQAVNVEKNNVKGDERFFVPQPREASFDVKAREIVVPFEYRPLTEAEQTRYGHRNQQDNIIAESLESIPAGFKKQTEALAALLARHHEASDGAEVSFLAHHLRQYTRRNTSDFFVHKDLNGFLSRELDFYLKNEVLNLDELEAGGETRAEGWFQIMRVIMAIGSRIIEFLAQIEDFQKRLFEKRKFITETQYCITLGTISKDFYGEIAACEGQWQEWKELFHIDEEERNLFSAAAKSKKDRRVVFLKAHPTLVLDTKHFDGDFRDRLLASFDDLDEMNDGLLIHSENFQALSLLLKKYRETVKCIYIDPPYNTDASPIIYKNGYRRSSWIALLADRLSADTHLRAKPSVRCIAIDDFEYPDLIKLLGRLSPEVHHATACVPSKPQGRPTATGFSANHECAIFWGDADAKIGRLPRIGSKAERYPCSDEKGVYAWANFRKSGTDSDRQDRRRSFYPLYVRNDKVRIPEMSWNGTDETWAVTEQPRGGEVAVRPIDTNGREKVWTCSPERASEEIDDIRVERDAASRIEILKKYRPNQEGALPGTWWDDPSYSASESGTKILKDILGAKDFDYPKSVHLVRDCLRIGQLVDGGAVLDYFAGSGTTGHAVINLNREDGGRRTFILIEMADHFDAVLLPRIKKVTYTPDWKGGKAARQATEEEAQRSPRIVKYIRLESYEDALNNITFSEGPRTLYDFDDYMLRYMLEWETKESATLLNIQKLAITQGQETREKIVDIPETFGYLLGLHVMTRRVYHDKDRRYVVYRGSIDHREVVVVWRDTTGWEKKDYERDKTFVTEQDLTEGADEIFVNGDSFIPKAKALDGVFKSRMFGDP